MIVDENTTAIDLAYNLSGSLTGFPAAIFQLPVGKRIGFDTLPKPWEDVEDIGQTWTPTLTGLDLTLDLQLYNSLVVTKAPFTTNLYAMGKVAEYGNAMLNDLLIIPPFVTPTVINSTWQGGSKYIYVRSDETPYVVSSSPFYFYVYPPTAGSWEVEGVTYNWRIQLAIAQNNSTEVMQSTITISDSKNEEHVIAYLGVNDPIFVSPTSFQISGSTLTSYLYIKSNAEPSVEITQGDTWLSSANLRAYDYSSGGVQYNWRVTLYTISNNTGTLRSGRVIVTNGIDDTKTITFIQLSI